MMEERIAALETKVDALQKQSDGVETELKIFNKNWDLILVEIHDIKKILTGYQDGTYKGVLKDIESLKEEMKIFNKMKTYAIVTLTIVTIVGSFIFACVKLYEMIKDITHK